jgi:hypothetical protein
MTAMFLLVVRDFPGQCLLRTRTTTSTTSNDRFGREDRAERFSDATRAVEKLS